MALLNSARRLSARHRVDREAGVRGALSGPLEPAQARCTLGPAIAERDADSDTAGRTPHAHDLRKSEVDLGALHPAARDEFLGRSDDEFFGLRPHDGAAEVGNDGDPQRTDLIGAAAEPGLIALDPRETSRVPRVEAVGDVEVAGSITGAAADGALDRRGVAQDRPRSAGIRPKVDLRPIRPQKPAGCGSIRRHRLRWRARRGRRQHLQPNRPSSRQGSPKVPGVSGRSVDLGGGLIGGAEFAGCRLHGGDRAGGLQPFDGDAIGVEHLVGEGKRSKRRRPASDRQEFLHGEGDTPVRQRDIGGGRRHPGRLGIDVADRVEVVRLDGGERGFQFLTRASLTRSECLHKADDVSGPWRVAHTATLLRPIDVSRIS